MHELAAAGLSTTEARIYTALLKKPLWKPSELARSVQESRTNCYKLLDSLIAKRLAEKVTDHSPTLRFRALHPSRLIQLSQERQEQHDQEKKQLNETLSTLTAEFTKTSELPGVSTHIGKRNIQIVFQNALDSGDDLYLIRSPHDVEFYSDAFFQELAERRAAKAITTHALTPVTKEGVGHSDKDTQRNFIRHWLPRGSYTSPVEWNVYGNKTAIILYGDEEIALEIESPALADSMRQLFKIISKKSSSKE